MRSLIHAKSNIQREFQMDGIFGVINELDKMITKTLETVVRNVP